MNPNGAPASLPPMSLVEKLKALLGRSRGATDLEQTYSKQVAEAERERDEHTPDPSGPPDPPTGRSF